MLCEISLVVNTRNASGRINIPCFHFYINQLKFVSFIIYSNSISEFLMRQVSFTHSCITFGLFEWMKN